jgi:hypothetical protein
MFHVSLIKNTGPAILLFSLIWRYSPLCALASLIILLHRSLSAGLNGRAV